MAKCKCLINGKTLGYNAAYPLDSTAKISPQFEYIGVGVIVEVKGKPYNGTDRLRFYRIKPKMYNKRFI